MQNLVNFWNFLFWLSLIMFLTNVSNLVKLVFYSEIIWVIFYCYILVLGTLNDDLSLISTSFFILGFAGLEYSIGILIILIYKNINNSIYLDNYKNVHIHSIYLKKNLLNYYK